MRQFSRSPKPVLNRAAPLGRAAPFRRRLVIMTKLPVMGRVKTRLACEVGQSRAIGFYRSTVGAILARLARDRRWQTILAVAPDEALPSCAWPVPLARLCQGAGDLGVRMQRIFDRLPPGPAIIVGTDIPAIQPAMVFAAFQRLGSHDAVFGPTEDGGYWLVGLKRCPSVPRPFARVRWSSANALADTRANVARYRVAMVERLTDVDDAESLLFASAGVGRRIVPRG
jgi:rSAM/selenodomain-associated transferase 1